MPAEGNSMYPFIREGEVCRFDWCEPSLLKKGDTALFLSASERLVAHRFSHSESRNDWELYVFKGDANLGFDEPIAERQIIGKLTSIQKRHVKLKANGLIARIWGSLVLAFPLLSGLIRTYLNRKHGR